MRMTEDEMDEARADVQADGWAVAHQADPGLSRGYHYEGGEDGMSWTLDQERAEWFSKRLAQDDDEPTVVEGVIFKENVIGYFNGRTCMGTGVLPHPGDGIRDCATDGCYGVHGHGGPCGAGGPTCGGCNGHGSLKAAARHDFSREPRNQAQPLGIHVLRCEDCGHPMSEGTWHEVTHEQFTAMHPGFGGADRGCRTLLRRHKGAC